MLLPSVLLLFNCATVERFLSGVIMTVIQSTVGKMEEPTNILLPDCSDGEECTISFLPVVK